MTRSTLAEVAALGGAVGTERKEVLVCDGGDDLRAAEAACHS